MSDRSANLSMPYIQPSQAQKHVTHNEALRQLDALVQLSVHSATQSAPPPAPNDGDRFLLPASSTGSWAGNDGNLAVFQDPSWAFYAPKDGWMAWIEDEGKNRFFDGSDWVEQPLQNLDHLGIQTTADTTNRLAVAAPATLLTHAGAGYQLKINKNVATDTASVLFQTNWLGRAEMGLAGNNDFSIKVSNDGATFRQSMVADAATGAVTFPFGLEGPAGPQSPSGVISASLTAPPGSPAEGDRYIVASGATGAWAGWDNSVARFSSGAWLRLIPQTGWQVLDETMWALLMWDDSVWITLDVGLWHPMSLFQSGEAGVVYLPSPATCWQDSARTIQGAVDSPVGALDDLSGNGHHALQATATKRPMLRRTANGRWYLEADGVDDFLQFSPLAVDPQSSVLAGFALSLESAGSNPYFIGGSGDVGLLYLKASSLGLPRPAVVTTAGVIVANAANPVALGVAHTFIQEWNRSTGELTLAQDGTQVVTVSGTPADLTVPAPDYILFGQRSTVQFMNSRLYGMTIVSAAVSDADKANLNKFLDRRSKP